MGPELKPRERNSDGGAAGTLPTSSSRSRIPKSRQIQNTFKHAKIPVLCAFVTVLVVHGTIGISDIRGSTPAEARQTAEDSERVLRGSSPPEKPQTAKDIEHVLREIRAGVDPADLPPDLHSTVSNPSSIINFKNLTYQLGPKISDWDQQRRHWLSSNPNFPSHVTSSLAPPKSKPRILLVTGSSPNPCDTPIGDHYLLKSTKNKLDYCRLHDIELFYNTAHLDAEFSGFWAKIPLLRRLLLSHPEAEWIWWIDSDAFFTDMSFELPLEKYSGKNLVIHGYPDLFFKEKSWISLNTGSFLLRNSQWSLDLLDAWAPMGPAGAVREAAGRLVTRELKGRPDFEADDQSALIYLLLSEQEKWMPKTFIENSFFLHGHWPGLAERYEEVMEKYHPGFGDERWPFVTHFVGCKPCNNYGDYPAETCLKSMERAFNFADNQVLRFYGFEHEALSSADIKRIRPESGTPLEVLAEEEKRQVAFRDSRSD